MTQLAINKTDQALFNGQHDTRSLETYFESLTEGELLSVENLLLAVWYKKRQQSIMKSPKQTR